MADQHNSEPIEILFAVYPSEVGGQQALLKLRDMEKSGSAQFADAAVLRKGADQQLQLSVTADAKETFEGVAGAALVWHFEDQGSVGTRPVIGNDERQI